MNLDHYLLLEKISNWLDNQLIPIADIGFEI